MVLRRALIFSRPGTTLPRCSNYRQCEVIAHIPPSWTTAQVVAYFQTPAFLEEISYAAAYARLYPRGDRATDLSETYQQEQLAALKEGMTDIQGLVTDLVRDIPGGEAAIFIHRAADGNLRTYVTEANAVAALGQDAITLVLENPGRTAAVASGVLLGMNMRRGARGLGHLPIAQQRAVRRLGLRVDQHQRKLAHPTKAYFF
jgi:hypothetical protein